MPLARTHSVALIGVTGAVVEVEADIANGLVGMILIGLPDTALREARDRIRAAIVFPVKSACRTEQYRQRRPPDLGPMNHQVVISEGRAALQVTLGFGSRHLGSAAWEPEPGSEAAAGLSNTETSQSGAPLGRVVLAHQQGDGLGQASRRPVGDLAPEDLHQLAGHHGSV